MAQSKIYKHSRPDAQTHTHRVQAIAALVYTHVLPMWACICECELWMFFFSFFSFFPRFCSARMFVNTVTRYTVYGYTIHDARIWYINVWMKIGTAVILRMSIDSIHNKPLCIYYFSPIFFFLNSTKHSIDSLCHSANQPNES